MGWFDDQIKFRKNSDKKAFSRSILHISNAVTGNKLADTTIDDEEKGHTAIDELFRYFRLEMGKIPAKIKNFEARLEYAFQPTGIMHRRVELTPGWRKDAFGAMLGFLKEGHTPVALIPGSLGGYHYLDAESGNYVKIDKETEALIEEEAFVFYRPFPQKELSLLDLFKYIKGVMEPSDYTRIILSIMAVTFIGMLIPRINFFIFNNVIADGRISLIISVGFFLLSVSIGTLILNAVKALVTSRIETKMSISVEAATMMRIFSLPAAFFRDYSSGELSQRASYVNSLCSTLVSVIFNTGLPSLFSLVYITQIFIYAPGLVAPAMIIILITVTFSLISTLMQMRLSKKQMLLSAKENGMSYAMLNGIQKIKLSGAEMRSFARWGDAYAGVAQLSYNPPLFLKINGVISASITIIGNIVMYNAAITTQVSTAEYIAFNSAYGMISAAFMSLMGIAVTAATIKPIFDMARPLLKTSPEVSDNKEILTSISGAIEINNISFKYGENSPIILDDLSLKINPGSYVAIVGRTGCGKSTLVRLLLGFEKPQKGGIYYDGRDINTLNLRSLRKNIGVVTQNGRLFSGDIFSNIVVAAPSLSLEDAWEAARIAGIDEDIRKMPMGMNTRISEGSGGISGGQKQRLMIARAIAPKPKLLIFDEATSALDNITQKKVSDALNEMKCTRIVIAHRLSTIKECDRILVFEGGKIVEDGTYDELLENKGFFSDLVARQMVNAG